MMGRLHAIYRRKERILFLGLVTGVVLFLTLKLTSRSAFIDQTNWGLYALSDLQSTISIVDVIGGEAKLRTLVAPSGITPGTIYVQRAREARGVYIWGFDSALLTEFPSLSRQASSKFGDISVSAFAISPDAMSLVYMANDDASRANLWLRTTSNSEPVLVAKDRNLESREVWVSNDTFIYLNRNGDAIAVNVDGTHGAKPLFSGFYIGEISPSGKSILLTPFRLTSNGIYLYAVESGKITRLKKWMLANVRRNFVWSASGNGFFYERQTLRRQLHLSESMDLFFFDLKSRKEIPVSQEIQINYLEGGIQLSEAEFGELKRKWGTWLPQPY